MKPLPLNDLEHVLSHTKPLWDEVRGRRFFLSGATGFFGAWLLESLLHCNRALDLKLSATVLTRNPEAFARRMPHIARDTAVTLWQGDVSSFDGPDLEFPYVIHGAAQTSAQAGSRPLELLNTLAEGTRQMLTFARQHNAKKFMLISSGAVYGRQPESMSHIPESYLGSPDWLDPNAAYAEGKRIAEQMCAIHARDSATEFKIARCFAFVGPHLPLDQHFAIGNFIGDALGERAILVRGDGSPLRSYLYAADLAIWLWTMLLRASPTLSNLDFWNVGSSEAIRVSDLARVVAEEIRPESRIDVAMTGAAGALQQQYVPDVRKAESELGLRQTIPLREAIRRTAEWYCSA